MRTTLDIDEDVLSAVRERARREDRTIGQTLSELARRALTSPAQPGMAAGEPEAVYGLRPLPHRGGVVSNELIDKLRDDDSY